MTDTSQEREGRILDAALDLIVHYGYDKTPVSEIAEAAGVSKGAIYLHFPSKTALFEALLQREVQNYMTDWLKRIEADPNGGTIGGVYKHILGAINANPLMQAMFKRDRRVLGKHIKQADQMFDATHAVRTRALFIQQMQAANVVRADVDPYITAYLMTTFVSGVMAMDDMVANENIPSFDALMAAMGDMMDGYLSDGATAANSQAGKRVIRETLATYAANTDT
jgi:AcrR family transcriptional regulator